MGVYGAGGRRASGGGGGAKIAAARNGGGGVTDVLTQASATRRRMSTDVGRDRNEAGSRGGSGSGPSKGMQIWGGESGSTSVHIRKV